MRGARMARLLPMTRGTQFETTGIVELAREGHRLRKQLIDSGNHLLIGAARHAIFLGDSENVELNPVLLRRIRKGEIDAGEVPPESIAGLQKLERYIAIANCLDHVTDATAEDLHRIDGHTHGLETMVANLRGGRAVAVDDLSDVLHAAWHGAMIPRIGTISERLFYDRTRAHPQRLILCADIIDLGGDCLQGSMRVMHEIAEG
ncbi:hypothetical protein ACFL6C_06635, partial [Myxococcota bacterium]